MSDELERKAPLCQRCKSVRVASMSAKCSDMCDVSLHGQTMSGYVPYGFGIGYDDYVNFNWCIDCGQIQDEFPLPLTFLEGSAPMEET